jgi:hypothetical protein
VFAEGGGRGSPRRATHFLSLRRKKVSKERATLHAASLRFAAGNLRCSCVGRAAELATRCALRSNNRSESDDEGVCPSAHARPKPCAPRRILKGTRYSNIHSGLGCARPRTRGRFAQRKASSTAHPATAPTQVCPAGAADCGSPFFCLLFFGEAKKSESAAGPRPDSRTQHQHHHQHKTHYKNNSIPAYQTSASSQITPPAAPETSAPTQNAHTQ